MPGGQERERDPRIDAFFQAFAALQGRFAELYSEQDLVDLALRIIEAPVTGVSLVAMELPE